MNRFSFIRGENLAVDLGTSNTVLSSRKGTAKLHPSYIAFKNLEIEAVGQGAFEMAGKEVHKFKVVKPLKGGVINDYSSANKMIQALVCMDYGKRHVFNRFKHIISGVPVFTTEVERRALRDILSQFGSSNSFLLYEPLAAAIGMGLNIQNANGLLVVNIGGGVTESAIISLSGIVISKSVRVGGDSFDLKIKQFIKENYQTDISDQVAENIKINVGSIREFNSKTGDLIHIVGKDSNTGIPKSISIDPKEVIEILSVIVSKIEEVIIETLEDCIPELSGDIYQNGVFLTGGGALLKGLKDRLENKLSINVHLDPNPLFSVINGILEVSKSIESYKNVLIK